MRSRLLLIVCSASLLHAGVGLAQFERTATDDAELARIAAKSELSAEHFVQAEQAVLARDFEKAEELLLQVAAGAPDSALVARWRCIVQLELGEPAAALDSCERAATAGMTPVDRWAFVRARTSLPERLSPREFSMLARHAAAAQSRAPTEVWGWAAECDLALAVDDRRMLDTCATELARIAPVHPETARAVQALRRGDAHWARVSWLAVLILGVVTLLHAFSASRRRLVVGGRTTRTAALVFVSIASLSSIARAESELGDPIAIDDRDPSNSVPGPEVRDKAPLEYGYLVMELAARADEAFAEKDYETAARYYQAVVKAAPESSVGYRKLCEALEALGKADLAVEACASALGAEGVRIADYTRYVNLKLASLERVGREDEEEVTDIIAHLRQQGADELAVEQLVCELGARLADETRLSRCVPILAAALSEEPRTITYQWSLALARGEHEKAELLLGKAKASKMEREGVKWMEQATNVAITRGISVQQWLLVGFFAALLATAMLLWRKRPRATTPPTPGA